MIYLFVLDDSLTSLSDQSLLASFINVCLISDTVNKLKACLLPYVLFRNQKTSSEDGAQI